MTSPPPIWQFFPPPRPSPFPNHRAQGDECMDGRPLHAQPLHLQRQRVNRISYIVNCAKRPMNPTKSNQIQAPPFVIRHLTFPLCLHSAIPQNRSTPRRFFGLRRPSAAATLLSHARTIYGLPKPLVAGGPAIAGFLSSILNLPSALVAAPPLCVLCVLCG